VRASRESIASDANTDGQRSECEQREHPIRCTVRLAEQPIVVGMASNPEPHESIRGFGGKRAVV